MGADVIGWRTCPLQQQEGEDGFFRKLKLLAYKRETDRLVPEPTKRANTALKVRISGQPEQQLSYPQVVEAVGSFAAGIPECRACPVSGGAPLGCYRYISYPISLEVEESLARFSEQELALDRSPFRILAEEYVRNEQARELSDGFRNNRGVAPGHLAARSFPVVVTAPSHATTLTGIDSADLLCILLPPFREGAELELEADLLETWLRQQTVERLHERQWAEWSSLARLMRQAAILSLSNPDVAVLFDG